MTCPQCTISLCRQTKLDGLSLGNILFSLIIWRSFSFDRLITLYLVVDRLVVHGIAWIRICEHYRCQRGCHCPDLISIHGWQNKR